MIRKIICIVLIFPASQQYPLENKEIELSESRLQNESPHRLNFIPTTTPHHLTKARPLRRKPRNVFKLPDHVWEGREEINRSEYLSKSKLNTNKQHSSKGVFKSKNVFKLPNNVWKTKGQTVQPKEKLTHNNFKTRSTTSSNVWKTKGPTVQPKEKLTHNNFKTRSTTSSNVWKTRGTIVYKNKTTDKVTSHTAMTMPTDNKNDGNRTNVSVPKLSQTTEYETNNIGMVAGSIIAIVVTLVIAAIVLYNAKGFRKRIHVFSICILSKRQSRTINGEIPNPNDIELQLMNGQKESIGIDTENTSD
ncbi:unnamed protein product [Mytilus coruscus]|uniref:Uncharacterized protein n=1 Tax=Mytilus coruscus TaxID=42192 RepID=A0A6J8EYV0_MYTCO|nr:unnamed protein product [Mytilus coruscus]